MNSRDWHFKNQFRLHPRHRRKKSTVMPNASELRGCRKCRCSQGRIGGESVFAARGEERERRRRREVSRRQGATRCTGARARRETAACEATNSTSEKKREPLEAALTPRMMERSRPHSISSWGVEFFFLLLLERSRCERQYLSLSLLLSPSLPLSVTTYLGRKLRVRRRSRLDAGDEPVGWCFGCFWKRKVCVKSRGRG